MGTSLVSTRLSWAFVWALSKVPRDGRRERRQVGACLHGKLPSHPCGSLRDRSVACSLHALAVVLRDPNTRSVVPVPLCSSPYLSPTPPDHLLPSLIFTHGIGKCLQPNGQEDKSLLSCRGPCKMTNAAFCPEVSPKGHQIAKESLRESS